MLMWIGLESCSCGLGYISNKILRFPLRKQGEPMEGVIKIEELCH